MVKKAKAIAAPVLRVPQDRNEATTMIAEYGRVLRDLEHQKTEMNQALADLKEKYVAQSEPLKARSDELFKGLQMFCDSQRATLTNNGRTKTVDMGTGKVIWKWNPPKVTHPNVEEEQIIARIEAKIAELKERGETGDLFAAFLRTKTSLDKDAMRSNADLARTIAGVRIGRGGETFDVEPFADEQLAEAS